LLQEQHEFIKTLLEEKQRLDARAVTTPHYVTISTSVNPGEEVCGNPWEKSGSKNDESSDLDEYSLLIQRMLQAINSCKGRLEQRRYSRIKTGVLSIHSREILQFQLHHGQSILQRFDGSLFAYVLFYLSMKNRKRC
jgi:hypothetical protein